MLFLFPSLGVYLYSFEFHRRLKRLNPLFFVNENAATGISSEWKAQGLYIRRTASAARLSDFDKVHLDGDARRFVDDQESGQRSEFICSIPMDWVPEFDVFDPDKGRLLARGWRSLVILLIKRGYCTPGRARDVFGSSVGETRYDRMSFEARQQEAREAGGHSSAKLDPRVLGFGNY